MSRALLLVLDSVGCGAAPDAAAYGDAGANTIGHILEQLPDLQIPNLRRLGWNRILGLNGEAAASFGVLHPKSAGKDTTTGHWELAGVVLEQPFATFESFPPELVNEIETRAGVSFIGNVSASGTTILDELGEQHVHTGRPILYTSADSVIQIAAHEEVFGLQKLYEVCQVAREVADKWSIGRVIARPFIGEKGAWKRTSNRKDFSLVPPRTILNTLQEAGITTIGVGKISDIFAGSGLDESFPTKSNADGMARLETLWREDRQGFIFANFVDFDTLYGHRRDIAGYGQALEEFDAWLGNFTSLLAPSDLVLITADHGNDPSFAGTDHTRENVPLLQIDGKAPVDLGTAPTFAVVADTIRNYFGVN